MIKGSEIFQRESQMIHTGLRIVFVLGVSTLVVTTSPSVGAQELRIGFLGTSSGSGAIIGKQMENGWRLGLDHAGWRHDGDRLGGVPTMIHYGDDQMRSDAGVKEADKLIKQHRVHIIAGLVASNVALAIAKPVFDARILLLSTNASAAPFAGEQCNPLLVVTSFDTDGSATATGVMATRDAVKSIVTMAPNYQSGKDYIVSFEQAFTSGKVLDRILFKLGEADFQADLAKVAALSPEGVFIFAPGAMGIAFMKQWAASGLDRKIKLYTLYTVNELTLPALGDAAIGAVEASHWNRDLDNPINRRFVKDYIAKFEHAPAFIAVHAYDAVGLIAKGVAATGGRVDDMVAVSRAIRTGTIDSPRGTLHFNTNGFVIQPFWRVSIVRGADGKPIARGGEKILDERPDRYAEKCPPQMRVQ
jgi:branched-chain amino acid transport system substrate-binding protein